MAPPPLVKTANESVSAQVYERLQSHIGQDDRMRSEVRGQDNLPRCPQGRSERRRACLNHVIMTTSGRVRQREDRLIFFHLTPSSRRPSPPICFLFLSSADGTGDFRCHRQTARARCSVTIKPPEVRLLRQRTGSARTRRTDLDRHFFSAAIVVAKRCSHTVATSVL